jgi:hypothetical protein
MYSFLRLLIDALQLAAGKLEAACQRRRTAKFEARLSSEVPFTDAELTYAAESRCPCGHGMAYPIGCGPHHYWDCSAIKGTADDKVQHTARLSFVFYEIKSEHQPSTKGATTRPAPHGATAASA